LRAKIGVKIDQFLPYFFARFYRCIVLAQRHARSKIGFGDDLGIFLGMEGGKGYGKRFPVKSQRKECRKHVRRCLFENK
jgi:hypothetical protein